MFGRRSAGGAIIVATALMCAACGKSEQPAPQSETPAAQPAAPQEAPSATRPGVKAYVDEAGNLRAPTEQELATEASQKATPGAAIRTQKPAQKREVLPDGTVVFSVDQSMQKSLQACLQPDGKIETKHACDDTEAKAGHK